MHVVIISGSVNVGTELMEIFAPCKYVNEISYIDTTEELFELKESTLIDVIFIFLDQSSELGAILFTDIQDKMLDLRRKIVLISPLSENLTKNHMIENALAYPLNEKSVLDMIDNFYIEQED